MALVLAKRGGKYGLYLDVCVLSWYSSVLLWRKKEKNEYLRTDIFATEVVEGPYFIRVYILKGSLCGGRTGDWGDEVIIERSFWKLL